MLAMVVSESSSVPTFVSGGLRGSTATSDLVRCMCVCHRGHYEGLSSCRLVGGRVLPGENFFTYA